MNVSPQSIINIENLALGSHRHYLATGLNLTDEYYIVGNEF